MIENPKIGQKVWFVEHWSQCIHSAKITALGETEASVRDPKKYPYADIEWDDGAHTETVCFLSSDVTALLKRNSFAKLNICDIHGNTKDTYTLKRR